MRRVGDRKAVKDKRWPARWLGERMRQASRQPLLNRSRSPGAGGRKARHGGCSGDISIALFAEHLARRGGKLLLRSRTPRSRVRAGFQGVRGNRCAEVLAGRVLIGGPWSLATYGNSGIFRDNGLAACERIRAFEFRLCPGPLVPCARASQGRPWFQVSLKARGLSSAHAAAA